ncbi:hypothetical protein [Polyangium sp. 15x6]|uniref:hypothetical protein n=1 Tax=Polyangium sp. 15x6 TaxID=3042687 RepID=UPI00249A6195|nr:hypothetical protein [Polyangium sp. 15x6]MDI3289004.1 hypothetical protein [Polyangium sp. 15x6]
MKTLHRAGRAIMTGFGLALFAALAFVNGCGSEDASSVSGPWDEPSNAAAAVDAARSSAPVGIWKCHRDYELRALVVMPGPFGNNTCSITAGEAPGASDLYCDPEDGCLPCAYLQRLWNCPTT